MLNDPRNLQMDKNQQQPGIYVYERTVSNASPVLKELLQLCKTVAGGKSSAFSYVHGNSALIPNLTLWENLQLSCPHELWDDFVKDHHPALTSLISLIKEPYKKAAFATDWECFLISLMKGVLEPTPHLLVNMQENMFPPFIVKTIKSAIMKTSVEKVVYLSTEATSMWLDCAHNLVKKNGYAFVFEEMNQEALRQHWVA